MNRPLTILFLLLLSGNAIAADRTPPKVAVLDLQAQGVSEDETRALTGVLLAGLAQGGGIDLLGKSDLASILSLEQTKLLLGCPPEDPRCLTERGQSLGDAVLVWGSVGQVGDRVVISAAAVDMRGGTTLGRASRTVKAGDGKKMVDATETIAAELRAALGLPSEANWKPIMSISLRVGGVLCKYVADQNPDALLAAFEVEPSLFLTEAIPLFMKAGITFGGDDNKAVFLPISLGIKYRWIREWLTPYIGFGVGLEFLNFSDETGGLVSFHALGGIELNPWKRIGFSVDGGFSFSRTFAANDFTQIALKLHSGVIYRF